MMRHEGYLRHLLVYHATKTSEIIISLVTTTQYHPALRKPKEALLAHSMDGIISMKNYWD